MYTRSDPAGQACPQVGTRQPGWASFRLRRDDLGVPPSRPPAAPGSVPSGGRASALRSSLRSSPAFGRPSGHLTRGPHVGGTSHSGGAGGTIRPQTIRLTGKRPAPGEVGRPNGTIRRYMAPCPRETSHPGRGDGTIRLQTIRLTGKRPAPGEVGRQRGTGARRDAQAPPRFGVRWHARRDSTGAVRSPRSGRSTGTATEREARSQPVRIPVAVGRNVAGNRDIVAV